MNDLNGGARLSKMNAMLKVLAGAALTAALSGCLMREGNPYNVGKYPHQWVLPGPETEERVFGPMHFEDVRDFVIEMERDGWRVMGYEAASLPEDVMVNTVELDSPTMAPRQDVRYRYTRDLPKRMDDRLDAPALKIVEETGEEVDSIPTYLDEDVRAHRQKYLVIMSRWN